MAPKNRLKIVVLGLVLSLAACPGSGEPKPESEEGAAVVPRLAPGANLGTTAAPRRVVVDESPRPVGLEVVRFFLLGFPEGALDGEELLPGTVPSFFWTSPPLPGGEWPISTDVAVPLGLDLIAVRDVDGDGVPGRADRRSAAPVRVGPAGEKPLQFLLTRGLIVGSSLKGELIRRPPGTLPTPEKLQVSATAEYGTRWEGAVFVLGYPEGSGGASSRATLPSFVWRQKSVSADFPFLLSVPLFPELEYVVVLDITGDLVPSVGDAATQTWTPAVKGSTSATEVIQLYRGTVLAFEDEVSGGGRADLPRVQAPGGSRADLPRVQAAEGGKYVPRRISFSLGSGVPADWSSPVMIVGFAQDSVQGGQPSRGGRHKFFWESGPTIDRWPSLQGVELPEDLLYFAVLDVDGNQRPSPGDWSSSAFGVGQTEAMEVLISGVFGPDRNLYSGQALDDDDSSEGADLEAEDGAPTPATVQPSGMGRSVLRQAIIDAEPRVPFLRRARVLVAGFSPDSIERGMPAPLSMPSYFWSSEQLPIDWPMRAEIRLPDTPGQTVYVILDLDDNGRPSPGDLSSSALVNYEVPSARLESKFLLDKAYAVSQRLAPTASP